MGQVLIAVPGKFCAAEIDQSACIQAILPDCRPGRRLAVESFSASLGALVSAHSASWLWTRLFVRA